MFVPTQFYLFALFCFGLFFGDQFGFRVFWLAPRSCGSVIDFVIGIGVFQIETVFQEFTLVFFFRKSVSHGVCVRWK